LTYTYQLGHPQTQTTVYHIHLRTHKEECLFGQMVNNAAKLNVIGQIVADELLLVSDTYRHVALDHWAIFPDGIRALVMVQGNSFNEAKQLYGRLRSQAKPRALSSFITGFKAATATRVNLVRGLPGSPVWQSGYHEQRIEDDATLERIRTILDRTTGI
jgi:putative transposase